ncbi:hypothetical protein KIPB_013090 [Kipferlia bialata]|uniref:Pyruvate phosphate dikinase AMP/ATP-binding domain-containing protein n=1 Tax=Kipferlia bialata TaxID=797122 RepID=A0A9K3DAG0_9EUKA|nr:hypothetical protein KIPB_013090 [Kipferlia bialata]|eukprot:g13090.t1
MFHFLGDPVLENGVAQLGGKGHSLCKLAALAKNIGFHVPDGFVISSDTFRSVIVDTGVGSAVRETLANRYALSLSFFLSGVIC